MDLLTELESLIPELEKGLDQASSLQEMEALRVEFLGRKGRIARIMSRLPELEPAQRPLLGQTANRVKESLTAQFEAKKTALDNAEEAAALARFDAGLPGRLPWRGSLHPVTMVMEEICTIFKGLGYDIVSGPEVETDYYCFEALNIPPEHPARDMQDTLYVSDGIVLPYAYVSASGADHAQAEASRCRGCARTCLPPRLGHHAHADVPSGRRPARGQARDYGRSARDAYRVHA